MTNLASGQQSPLSAGSESPGTPPSNRKRDKARAFFGLSPSKSKVKPKASNQSPGSQLTTNVSRSPSTAFRVRNVPSDIQQSMSSSVIKPVSQTISFTADQPVTEIFSENMPEPIIKTALPALQDRIEQTQQLVYCNRLLLRGISSPSAKVSAENSAMESGDGLHDAAVQEPKFDETERAWLRAVQHHPDQQHHLRWLINNLVQEFAKDDLKGPAAIAEAVILGPVLDRDTYRSLLSCFITKFEQTTILDITLLQGLVQLIESASSGYLEDDDLVRTLGVLRQRLKGTHKQSSEQVYQTTLAISRLLDVMVNGMVKDLNRTDDHQPLVEVLNKLKDATDPILQFQVVYALQALQYIPDDESTLQAVLRFAGGVTMAALGVASICKLDPTNLFNSLDTLRQAAGQSYEVTKSILEGMEASQRGRFGAMQSLLKGFRAGTKHEWFLMLLAARTFVRNGRLADFNRTVCEAPCRDERAFQLGVCQILGEITMEPLWDIRSRQLAADFLGALHRNNSGWKQHSDVKHWIITILTQISGVSDSAVSDNALAVLQSLEQDDDTSNMSPLPLWSRLPLPEFCPLLTRVQHIPYVEYNLHQLNLRRIEEGHLPVYIPPMAKANLQARDDVLFPLMEKVQDFLGSSREVMLILGDSGAGKSTFNKHLESELLRSYTTGGPIPLFINLPALDRPDKELMAEQLQAHNFSDAQIQELKQHRQFVVICDGYDESQLKSNLHTTNLLNRSGQWKVKLIITCRTQYLGQDYRDLFVPQGSQGGGHYNHPAIDLFQEAVIAPFSTDQIELYVERYVPLEPRTWVKEDYMDKLNTIPNLMDLVKNPFLLTLTLGALPTVIQGKQDLSRFHITRVELYDNFVEHWLGANKRRLRNLKLSGDGLKVFEELLDDGFEQSGFNFQKDLAVAIFIQQEGRPVVDYTHNRDRTSWKGAFFSQEPGASLLRAASLLTRVGNQYRFIHRSVLEYFYSCIVCQSAFNNAELAPPVQFNPLITLSPIAEHPLSQSSLVPEPSVVQFLTERVNASPPFRQHLFDLIELSKTDPQASQAAANAMTVLVKTGVRFHGADLRGIRVPGADLSGGEFDSAQMEGADLRGVNLTRSWIRKVDFSNSQMDGVVFGELPYLEQSYAVLSCAYSPDGKSLAVGLANTDINIYDTSTWTRIHALHVTGRGVAGLSFSPSGLQVIAGDSAGDLLSWQFRRESSQCLAAWSAGSRQVGSVCVTAVAFSPCGEEFATIKGGVSVSLRDSRTGAELFATHEHTDSITSVAFSPCGKRIISGSKDGAIRMFDALTGQPGLILRTITESTSVKAATSVKTATSSLEAATSLKKKAAFSSVLCVGYSPDGQRVVSGDKKGQLRFWDAITGEGELVLSGHSGPVTGVMVSPNGHLIASSALDSTVRLWNAHTGALTSVLTGHSAPVTGVSFSPDGLHIASVSQDKTVRLWQVTSAESSLDAHGHTSPIASVIYSTQGRYLLSGIRDGFVRQYDAATGDLCATFPGYSDQVRCVTYSSCGLFIATAGDDNHVRMWNSHTGEVERVFSGNKDDVTSLAFSPCGIWIASGCYDRIVRIWEISTGKPCRIWSGHVSRVTSLSFAPTGLQLVSGGWDGAILAWELGTKRTTEVRTASRSPVAEVVYTPDGLRIASSHLDGTLRFWDQQTLKTLHTLKHDHAVDRIAFSSCGQWIATSCSRTVWIWRCAIDGDREKWCCESVVQGFFGPISSIAWKPEALEFVTGCEDGSTRVWKMRSESDGYSVRLVWGSGCTALVAAGADFTNVVGFSTINRHLLKQRNALGVTSDSEDDGSEDD